MSNNRNQIYRLSLLTSLVAGITGSASAQSVLDQSISVDGRYAAEVIRMERIGRFPQHLATTMPVRELTYDLKNSPFALQPSFLPVPTPGRIVQDGRGYADIALGSWLDAEARAGVWIIPESSDWSLGAWLSHSSTSLWKPKDAHGEELPHRFAYDEAIGLQTGHSFANGSRFDASLSYNLKYFNYFCSPERETQTVNDFQAYASYTSSPDSGLRYGLDFSAGYFGYRSFRLPIPEDLNLYPSRETDLHIGASLSQDIEGGIGNDTFSLGLSLDGIFPGHGQDYGNLSLTPAYGFRKGMVNVELGAEIDLTLNAGEKDNDFSFLHIAPACKAWIPTRHFTYYLTIGGGSELSTLRNLSKLTPWQSPMQLSTAPVFSPVDVALGFNGGPSSGRMKGFEGGLEIRYKAVSHLPLLGWYPALLATGGMESTWMLLANCRGEALHGFSFRGNLGWSLSSLLRADISLEYSPQSISYGYFNGIDRPEWIGNLTVGVNPVSPLTIRAMVEWRGNRRLTGRFGGREDELQTLSLPDFLSVSAEADWNFTDRLSVGIGAYNLTNRRKNLIVPGIDSEGIVLAGKVSVSF